MSDTRLIAALAFLATTSITTAQDMRFYRLNGPSNTSFSTMPMDGRTSWSNEFGSGTCVVETATILWPVSDWHSYVYSPVTGMVSSVQFFDPSTPAGMAFIPAGVFRMGDAFGEGNIRELPLHWVYVSAFYMDKYEVTKALWDDVYPWATNHGYTFYNAGSAKASNHPVYTSYWYDMVKWCNARSEKEGLVPCYYGSDTATVFRTGWTNLPNECVKWDANGYRLPTEAEWEKAARGGALGARFAWSDYTNRISHLRANFKNEGGEGYAFGTTGWHPDYTNGATPYTSPVGTFAPNDYGLYDMSGNVFEWCWDLYDVNWYGDAAATQADTHGPTFGAFRVFRGGTYNTAAWACRAAFRLGDNPGAGTYYPLGFRCVRGKL